MVELLPKKPKRLIVEPTGVAAVDSVRQVFADPGIAAHVMDPLLVVVDPRQWDEPRIREHPLYQEQRASADVIAMSHVDCCDPELIERFKQAHADVALTVSDHGRLHANWSDKARAVTAELPGPVHSKGITKHVLEFPADWQVPVPFIRTAWEASQPPASVLRAKGIIRTGDGWCAVQFSGQGQELDITQTESSDRSYLVAILFDDEIATQWWNSFCEALNHFVA